MLGNYHLDYNKKKTQIKNRETIPSVSLNQTKKVSNNENI